MPAAGANFIARRLNELAANPDVWAKTVFILNYDENDGLFDHVAPPVPPAGTSREFVDDLPIGSGMSSGVERQLFEPFFTTKKKGLGLGLSISRALIAAHNGNIRSAHHQDRGTTFSLPPSAEGWSR